MLRTRMRIVAAVLFAMVMQMPGASEEVVEIRLRGYFFVEPATLNIAVTVDPHALNRQLRIEADSLHLFRSSVIALAGQTEKRLHMVVFKNLPAGAYVVRAQVMSSNTMRGQAEQELIVTGAGRR